MNDAMLDALKVQISLGKLVAWINEGQVLVIASIEKIAGEACGISKTGRYVDLWNVEPNDLYVLEPALEAPNTEEEPEFRE